MKRILMTFNSSNYTRGNKKLFNGSFSKYFDDIICMTEKNLDTYISNIVQYMIDISGWKRGYGYWIWKPYIILKQLEKLNDNDILFYLDSHFNFNDEKLIDQITNDLRDDKYGLFWGNEARSNDLIWTTKKLVNCVESELNYKFSNKELEIEHGDAGLLFIKKTEFTIKFLKQWFEIMLNHKEEITDKFNNDSDNAPGFIENRHDQSVFNLMIKYYKLVSPSYIKYWAWGSE